MNQKASRNFLVYYNNSFLKESLVFISIILMTAVFLFSGCEKPERVIQLTTLDALPADISYTTATLKGEITDLGSDLIEDHGIIVGVNSIPITSNSDQVSLGICSSRGKFQVDASDLTLYSLYFMPTGAIPIQTCDNIYLYAN